jgi:hypothetical protein
MSCSAESVQAMGSDFVMGASGCPTNPPVLVSDPTRTEDAVLL